LVGWLIVSGALGTTGAVAQRPRTAEGAREVAEQFFRATERQEWALAASLLDLRTFEGFFRQTVDGARVALPQPEQTVESYLANQPAMPRVVAEWFVAESKRYKRPAFQDFSETFAGVRSFRELAALSTPDAAARWLEATDPRERMRRLTADSLCREPSVPPDSIQASVDSIHAMAERMRHRIVGVAQGDDSTAYVLHYGGGIPIPQDERHAGPPAVMILRAGANGWLIDWRHELFESGFVMWAACVER
jgi:hypothetical protein